MRDSSTAWQIHDDANDSEVQPLLKRDRVWNSFALADLLPPFRAFTRFATAARPGEQPSATLMIVEHPSFTTVSPFGDADGVAAILARMALPPTPLVQTLAAHRPLLEAVYRPMPVWREMLRMAVTAPTFTPQPGTQRVERLTMAEGAEASDLYRLFPETPFRPDLLDQDSFVGLWTGGRLVAAAGTHVLAETHGIAVVGNVFTHPDERGKGYAGLVTSALVAQLYKRGCRDVVLNVFADNAPAIAVYQRLGFQAHHHLWSGPAELRPEIPR